MELCFVVLWVPHCCDQVYAKIHVKYEPENDVKLHMHAKMQKNVLANVAKEQEYHKTKYGDSMNALAL